MLRQITPPNNFVNGHSLQDDPHDMDIRGFGRIKIWDDANAYVYFMYFWGKVQHIIAW